MLRQTVVFMLLSCFAVPLLTWAEDNKQPQGPISLISIKAGSFKMGSNLPHSGKPPSEFDLPNQREYEKPAHKVTLTKAFSIGATEVTQAQYKAVMTDNPSEFTGDDRPVDSVSWHDAMKFCRKMTSSERKAGRLPEGMEYRLPTEAEWEYCCRAGTTTEFCFGDDPDLFEDYGWNEDTAVKGTHPVRGKKANAWGLYDMHGNVGEWCLDWCDSEYTQADEVDPAGTVMGRSVTVRGGSWDSGANECRSAYRCPAYEGRPDGRVGFRVVLAPVIVVGQARPAEADAKDADWYKDTFLPLAPISPGAFKMGAGGSEWAQPIREVTITHAFYMGATEVTQGQYNTVMNGNPSHFRGDSLPVDSVTWYDAMEFCRMLTEIEHKDAKLPKEMEYRLPTEAEWEFCCRAGSTGPYCFGGSPVVLDYEDQKTLGEYAWFCDFGKLEMHPVGTKKPNAWGLYDMHGNVWEWCRDCFAEVYDKDELTDPFGPSDGYWRSLRGGSIYCQWLGVCSAVRSPGNPRGRQEDVGFRVVAATAPIRK
ncbi:MAG: formylglycine-generating enzyme family protein [Candidatus Brocadiia bacterium]